MKRTTAAAPAGVAWPTVSATQTRVAPARIAVDVELPQRVGIGAGRVLGDVHHRQPFAHREGDRLLGQPQQLVERPALGVLPDRARADERAALDRHAGALRDLGDRPDVGDHRARRAVGLHAQPLRRRSPAPAARRRPPTCGPAPGSPMLAVSMPEPIDEVEDARASRRCVGQRTDGDCSPSRSVSSSSITARRGGSRVGSSRGSEDHGGVAGLRRRRAPGTVRDWPARTPVDAEHRGVARSASHRRRGRRRE